MTPTGTPNLAAFRSVLVTGAGGFVGGYLLPRLRAAVGDEARIVGSVREENRTLQGSEVVQIDLTQRDEVDRLVRDVQPDLVIHLAAMASVGQSLGATTMTWQMNVQATLNLAASIQASRPDCTALFGSSVEVYGESFNRGSVDEDTPAMPLSPYARSKRAAEWVLGDVLAPGNRLIIARPCNHSGPGQTVDFVLPAFAAQITAIERGTQPPVLRVGNLEASRDFLDVRDVVDAYIALLGHAENLPQRSVLNIASGQPRTIASMLDHMLTLTKADIVVEQDPARMRPSDIPVTTIDATRFRTATGWAPALGTNAMIESLLESYRRR